VRSDQPFRRRADVLWRRSLDAVVLLPAGADDVITLCGSGVDTWELLDTWRTIDALAELLAERFQTSPAVVTPDVVAFVDQLDLAGALEPGADRGGPEPG
jgi:hypothetical protein